MMNAPKYIPAKVMRKMTRRQLHIIQTQKNTKGKFSQNANNAQKILWRTSGYMNKWHNSLNMHEKTGWEIPTEETVDLSVWLNGTENLEAGENYE